MDTLLFANKNNRAQEHYIYSLKKILKDAKKLHFD